MRIKSHAPSMFAGMAAAGVIALGFIGTYIYLMRQAGRDVWYLYVLMAPFLLVGGLLAFFGVRAVLRLALVGGWQLDLPGEGGVLGRPLEVTLFPRRARVPTGDLTCHVRCIRIVRGSAGGRSGVTTLCETTWTTRAGPIHPAIGLPLSLPLPASGQPSQMDRRTGSGIQWQLNVVMPWQGRSEEPVFDLPVRR
jgi:hypothetical protein